MKKLTILLLIISHLAFGAVGFGLGIYLLPILIAPEAPTTNEINQLSSQASFSGTFTKDLADSDALHWGEGDVFIGEETISLMGKLSPGPDYRLYLSPEFVETEAKFNTLKHSMVEVGAVNTFSNFVVDIPDAITPADYTTVIIWCERFGEFITAAKYR